MRNTTKLAAFLVAFLASLMIAPASALAFAPAPAFADDGANMLVPASVGDANDGSGANMPGHDVSGDATGEVELDDEFTYDENDVVTPDEAVEVVVDALEAHDPSIAVPVRIEVDEVLPEGEDERAEVLQGMLRDGMKDLVEQVFAEDGNPAHGDYFRWTLSQWTYSAKGKLETASEADPGGDEGGAAGDGGAGEGGNEGGDSGSEGGGQDPESGEQASIIALYSLEFSYRCPVEYDAATRVEAEIIVNKLASDYPEEWQSKLGRIKVIYDYICSNVSYYDEKDYAGIAEFDDYRSNNLQFTAYGALFYHTAVCQGYDLLFYLMANMAGVETRIVSGTSNDGVNHGWNIVNLAENGEEPAWYNLDPTWDSDHYMAGMPYECFLKSDSDFADHIRGQGDRDTNGNLLYGSIDYTACSPDYTISNPSGGNAADAQTFPASKDASFVPRTATVSGVEYDLYASTATAMRVSKNATQAQKANVTIPGTITVDGASYTVTEIGAYFAIYIQEDADGGNSPKILPNEDLRSITMPDKVKRIGALAFTYCTALKAPKLPESLLVIDQRAFWACEGADFGSVAIPESVKKIGESAFEGCSSLKTVRVEGSETAIGYQAFANLADNSTLAVSAKQHSSMAAVPAITTGQTVVTCSDGNVHGQLKHVASTVTCTSAGIGEHWLCETCGSAFKDNAATTPASGSSYNAAALGHSWGAWTKVSDTQHRRTCSRNSSHTETAAHTWDAGTVTKAATTTATGVRTCKCTGCGATKTETIAKLAAATTPATSATAAGSATSSSANTGTSTTTSKSGTTSTTTGAKAAASTSKAATDTTKTTAGAAKSSGGATKATASTAGKTAGSKAAASTATQTSIQKAAITGIANKTYTGKAIKPVPVVKIGSKTLKAGTDYVVAYVNNKKVGTASVVIAGKGSYTDSVTKTFKIAKAKNTLMVRAKKATVKASQVEKKAKTIARPLTVKKAKGKVTYKKKSGNAKLKVNKKNGKVTVAKGTKKGTYKLKIAVTAKGNSSYKKATKTVAVKVYVK